MFPNFYNMKNDFSCYTHVIFYSVVPKIKIQDHAVDYSEAILFEFMIQI